jgi:hypothetical protein
MSWECVQHVQSEDPEGRRSITEKENGKTLLRGHRSQTKTDNKGVKREQGYLCLIGVTEMKTRREREGMMEREAT